MKKSTAHLLAVVLVFLAAVVWSAVAVFDFIYATPGFLRILRIICAGMWWIAFLVNLYRWRKSRKEDR